MEFSSIAPQNPSLRTLPVETLHAIIRHLDPVSVIAFSQTSTHLRRVVNPRKEDFIDRLLVLECRDEYGGRDSIFETPFVFCQGEPDWRSEGWQTNRWTCTGCLKLLPHTEFDNAMLLNQRYRKPLPGTSAAHVESAWTPSLYGKTWGRKALSAMSKEKRASLRRSNRYRVDESEYYNSDERKIEALEAIGALCYEFLGKPPGELDSLSESEKKTTIQSLYEDLIYGDPCGRLGSKRYRRKCNECRCQAGQLRTHPFRHVNVRLPVVYGRPVLFNKFYLLQRLFPGYWTNYVHNVPDIEYPATLLGAQRVQFVAMPTFMIRCYGCARWREYREFRFNAFSRGTSPSTSKSARDDTEWLSSIRDVHVCQSCFVRQYGREEFTNALLRSIHWAQDDEMRYLEVRLMEGWRILRLMKGAQENYVVPYPSMFLEKDWERLGELTVEMEPVRQRVGAGTRLDTAQILASEACLKEVNKVWARFNQPATLTAHWVQINRWRPNHDKLAKYWFWLQASMSEVQENPEILTDWALQQSK